MSADDDKTIRLERAIHMGRLLGEGGMGVVEEGFAADLGQHLAVKRLRSEWTGDKELCARFEEEAAIMASINHPGVLPVYGIGTDGNGQLFYAMKKVEGRTLGQCIRDEDEPANSVPRRKRLIAILLAACDTMAAAHQKGIIHRDIKPDNILVDQAGSTYVIDWGIAKHHGATDACHASWQTLPGKVMGTPGYMAPEQAEGRSAAAGPGTDVFALGVILYEILTTQRPFAAATERAELLGSIHREPAHPRRLNWLLPRDISDICLKALQKDPAKRYTNASGLAADLHAHLEGRPVSARTPNVFERVRYASRRRPMRALIISSMSLAVLALGAFVGSQCWIDMRLADKSMTRLAVIDSELAELAKQATELKTSLGQPGSGERERIRRDLEIVNTRWTLCQFEALRILNSVADLRFLRTRDNIKPLIRARMRTVIEASIDAKRPILAQSLIATLLERHEEHTLANPLSPEDVRYLKRLEKQAADLTANQTEHPTQN